MDPLPVAFLPGVQTPQKHKLKSQPFNVFVELRPTGQSGAEITVGLETATGNEVVLSKPPVVQFKVKGRKQQTVSVTYTKEAKVYAGTIENLSLDTQADVEIAATDSDGQIVYTAARFQISRLDPGRPTKVFSSDGQLSLTVPARGLAEGARVAIGPVLRKLPPLPNGYSIALGPFSVRPFPDGLLSQQGTLRFQFPHRNKDSGLGNYAAETLRVFHYDGREWADLGGVVHAYPIDVVSVHSKRLGVFALGGKVRDH
jgi:hypothetical protein